jgi:hypothetical protein
MSALGNGDVNMLLCSTVPPRFWIAWLSAIESEFVGDPENPVRERVKGVEFRELARVAAEDVDATSPTAVGWPLLSCCRRSLIKIEYLRANAFLWPQKSRTLVDASIVASSWL